MPPSALAKPALSLLVDSAGRRLLLSETVRRSDAWENEVTGFGTRRELTAEELSDRRTSTTTATCRAGSSTSCRRRRVLAVRVLDEGLRG